MKRLLILMLFLTGCTAMEVIEPTIGGVQLSIDNDVYHSNEIMHVSSSINILDNLDDVSVRIYGLDNRFDITKKVNLISGENVVEHEYKVPSYNLCSGIKKGIYNVNVEVSYDDKVIVEDSVDVEIR